MKRKLSDHAITPRLRQALFVLRLGFLAWGAWFYTCKRHVTLTMLAQEPSFEELRSLVVARLQDGSAPSSTEAPAGPSCNFAPYVLPGLEFGG